MRATFQFPINLESIKGDVKMCNDLTFSRRTVLRSAVAVGASVLAGGLGSWPSAAFADTAPETPDAARTRLLDGNRRFTEGKILAANRDLRS
jgi:hypothetical protein